MAQRYKKIANVGVYKKEPTDYSWVGALLAIMVFIGIISG